MELSMYIDIMYKTTTAQSGKGKEPMLVRYLYSNISSKIFILNRMQA